MRNIYFDGAVLTAMAHLAAKKDIRHYLNGVLLEVIMTTFAVLRLMGILLAFISKIIMVGIRESHLA